MQQVFKIGDKVRLLRKMYCWQEADHDFVPVGTVLTVISNRSDTEYFCSSNGMTIELGGVVGSPKCFELVVDISHSNWIRDDIQPQDIDGSTKAAVKLPEGYGDIFRPILEERKKDKVRIELFDDGFPNAIMEIAKVMNWANLYKGYKDHDWKSLPDAENALKGAASRHRVKANMQKEAGVAAKDRVDEESHIHHLAHQAFNVLAELELILTGKIK